MADEEALAGPMGASGAVRVGDTVRRPRAAHSAAVAALLRHLEDVGFDGAPRHLGLDEQGRDVVTYLDGDVPQPPYPAWAMTDRALDDLGRLVRRLHDATATFDRTGAGGWSAEWSAEWADPAGGPVVCHDDLYPENVVFRDGRVVALIDFDMAAPGRPLWDLAIAGEVWSPLAAPGHRPDHPAGLDAVARFGRLAAAYGLEPGRGRELVDVVRAERAASRRHIAELVAAGDPAWVRREAETGGAAAAAADDAWIEGHRDALAASVETSVAVAGRE